MTILDEVKNELLITNSEEDDLLLSLIKKSKMDVLKKMYPFSNADFDAILEAETLEVPLRYESNVIDITIYRYNKIGIQGQVAQSEGEVSRRYDSSYIPYSYLQDIVSEVGVPK